MSQITDELSQDTAQKESGFSFLQVVFLILLVLLAAVYMGETLFGKNSLDVLLSLRKQQEILDSKIARISKENAILQKKYFELRALMPEKSDEEQTLP
ncbi:MAG: septum formation initiator [Sulfurospirillum sp.]|nr:MAG: septum formation initiator [Sulfurospirillum sp.]